jgi:hypothetical protein
MNCVISNWTVLFFGAFLLVVAIDILETSPHAQAPSWQWQQWQSPNQYTSHTVDSSALAKETDPLPTRQMLGGALSKHPRTTRE